MSQDSVRKACETTCISATGWVTTAPGWLLGYTGLASIESSQIRFRNSHGGTVLWTDVIASAVNSKGTATFRNLPGARYFSAGIYASLADCPTISVAFVTDVANRG